MAKAKDINIYKIFSQTYKRQCLALWILEN